MQELTDQQNTALGVVAAFVEGVSLQPTLYWKNARIQNAPFSLDPRLIYRGTAASLCNEMGQMGSQFGLTGMFKHLHAGKDGGHQHMTRLQEMSSATMGGCLTAIFATPVEMIMIQQQLFGGTLWGTPLRIGYAHGLGLHGLMRGLGPAVVRDAIYVSGLLGVTPILQDYLEIGGMSTLSAGFWASLVGGVFGAVPSHPLDVVKTCMQGDLEQKQYRGALETAKLLYRESGVARFFHGCFWRTVNITATVFIANECRLRLPKHMF